ncbi:MAG: hypothetical protein K5668_00185 [Lachnospiraceae bacterium]|nr:hypothetical protein [Lachnospiraceae bacterium]
MKQIIVVTNDRQKYEKEFKQIDFYVTWCPFSVSALLNVRDRSNLIFVCVSDEEFDDIKAMGLYLRDLCIEDEKVVYFYGNKSGVDQLSTLVPSIFIKKTIYSHVHFSMVIEDLMNEEVYPDNKKLKFVLIDDDSEYVAKLRPYLDPFFQVHVSRFDIMEIGKLILRGDLVMISMNGRLKLSEFMSLFRMLRQKSETRNFHYYYITDTNGERARLNAGSESDGLAFSKEMEIARVANYFVSKYTDVKPTF